MKKYETYCTIYNRYPEYSLGSGYEDFVDAKKDVLDGKYGNPEDVAIFVRFDEVEDD